MNLQDYRKRKFKTIKAFAEALGKSPSTASYILQGRHHRTLNREEVQHLANVLGIPFSECVAACDASYALWGGYYTGLPEQYKLEYRWQYEDDLLEASKRQNWAAFNRKYGTHYGYRDPIDRLFAPLLAEECFQKLGLSAGATPEQVKDAFRTRVKAMADGRGGYTGDMDALVQAKEKALRLAGE